MSSPWPLSLIDGFQRIEYSLSLLGHTARIFGCKK